MELLFSSTATLLSFLLYGTCVLPVFPDVTTTNPLSSSDYTTDSNNSRGILQKTDTSSQRNQETETPVHRFHPTVISPVERRIQKIKCESLPCFNGGECVQKKFCDCSRYNASGSRCQIVYNVGAERDSICRTWGQYHFETFDGVYYFFPGKFTYDLLRQNEPEEPSFSIQVHNDPDCTSFPYSCKRSFHLYFASDGEIKLQNHKVLHNNLRVQLPYTVDNLHIQRISSYVIIRQQFVFTLAWDGKSSVYIKMSPDYLGKTHGLCGNNNGIFQDDLVTSYGKPTENIEEFVNSWRENLPHEESIYGVISTYDPPCPKESQQLNVMAHSLCSSLLQSPFRSCHESVSPSPFLASCSSDLCMSDGDTTIWCRALTEYARACAQAGHPLPDWRTVYTQCEIPCEGDLVYSECIKCCPSACQQRKSCIDSEIACVDGCYCREGLIFENGACVEPSACPCEFHGRSYEAGSVIQDQCNNCSCTGGKWICTEDFCPAECSITGDIHIITFDGRKYTFQAPCQYILAKSRTSGVFAVTLQNSLCGQNRDGSCIQSINVILDQDPRKQLTLTHSGDVLMLDQYKVNLPYTDDVFEVRKLSSVFIHVKTHVGLQLLHDRNGLRLYLQLDGRWKDDTVGLCGTFNGNTEDDFLSPAGVPESTPQLFGNSWKISSACGSEYFPSSLDPCDVHLQAASYASESCSIFTKELFSPCHSYLSPVSYYEQCRTDTCKCGQACLCSALAHYAHQCRRFGIIVDFRPSFPDCVILCDDTMEYGTCVSTCGQTCQALSMPEACDGECAEGCACPKGMFLDTRSDRCVQRNECPCYFQGIDYHPGENILTSLGKCHCNNGTMNCESRDAVYNCPPGQIYYNCSNPEEHVELSQERTCENQLLNLTASTHLPCISGCVCPRGLVKHGDECFKPDACPCSWKAKEYYPGDVVNSSCHTCVCQHGSFQCSFHPCPSMCTAYSDRHFRTFDGLAFDFVGACKVHLVKGASPSNLSITVENVNCYGGIICRKTISIRVGRSVIVFDDETGNPGPSSVIDRRWPSHLWQAGLYTFVHFPTEHLTVLWDQRTTIHIQAGPKWQAELSGLCGNFDLKTVNEMRSPDRLDLTNSQEFGNSWAAEECIDSSDIRNPCTMNPLREPFAKKECGILLGDVFEACHPVVDVTWFYSNCLSDTCGCNRGGDCECFCTSVSAYAHQCCQQGITIDWRSPRVCPYDCDYFNKGEYFNVRSVNSGKYTDISQNTSLMYALSDARDTNEIIIFLGKGPYKLLSYLDRSLVLASRISDGSVFPMRTEYLVPGDTASFMLTPGLYKPKAHGRNLVSLELADRPNYFLYLARNDTFLIAKWQKNEAFQNRSTFVLHKNSWISGYSAFECFAKPGFFLRISSSYIYLTRYHHSAAFRLSSLFKLADPRVKSSSHPTCEWKYDACSSACFQTCRDPQGEHCKEVPRVEGCFPSCPSHMVLDEVTRKCVFLEDCIEPPVSIPVLFSTPAPAERHTLSTAFNVSESPSVPFTSASSMKPDITTPKVSESSAITTRIPGSVSGAVPHTVISTNASITTPVSLGTLPVSQEPAVTLSQVSRYVSSSQEVFSSRPDTGISSSGPTPSEETVSTLHVARITEVKTDTDSSPSRKVTSTASEISRITLTPSIVSTERSQLPLNGTIPSTPPAKPITTTETEGATARAVTSPPSIKSSTLLDEKASVTILTNYTKPFISQFVSTMLTSKSTTSLTPLETEITSMSSTEEARIPTISHASTTEAERALFTTSASSVMLPSSDRTTTTVFPTSEISTERKTSFETTHVSQTEPSSLISYSTMTTMYPFSPHSTTEELLSKPPMGPTRPSGTTLTTESTTLPELSATTLTTSLPIPELVSLETGTTTQTQTPTDLTSKQLLLSQSTQTSKVTKATTPGPETFTTLLNATSSPPISKHVSLQTILTTTSGTEITSKVTTSSSATYSLHPALITNSTTSSYPLFSETSVAATSLETITTAPSLTSYAPLLTTQTKVEPTKPMAKIQTLSGITTSTTTIFSASASTGEMSHLPTVPGHHVTEVDTTVQIAKATTQTTKTLLNFTGTTIHPFTGTVSKTVHTHPTSMEYKIPGVLVTSPHITDANETVTLSVSTKHPETTGTKEMLATTDYTPTFPKLDNVTGSVKSIPYTGRTILPTVSSAMETIPTSAQTTSVKAAPGTISQEPSTTYSTRNVTVPFLSTTVMYPSIKTSFSVPGLTSESLLPDLIGTTQSTTQRTYSPFITSLSTAYPAVPFSTAEPLKTHLTTERQPLLTEEVNITHIASFATVLNTTTTPTGLPTLTPSSPSAVPPSGSETTAPEERTEKHLPSTEKVETLFMSTKHTTKLKDLSSTEIYKTTAQLISQPSSQSEGVSETLATHQPTLAESVSLRLVTEETSTPAITITRDTVSEAPKTTFPSTTSYSPQVITSHGASLAAHSIPQTEHLSERTSPGVTPGLTYAVTHVAKTIEKNITEVLTTTEKAEMYSSGYGATKTLTSKSLDIIASQTSPHITHVVNETESVSVSKTTQSPYTEVARTTSLTSSVQTFLPTSQEPKLKSSTAAPTQTLMTTTYPSATIGSTVAESVASLTTTEVEPVTGHTKTEDITEGISPSSLMPPETATAQTCVPYTENDCIKYICVDGQLIQVNKSLHCPYNATQPSCGLLGFAVQINGDKCCPKWECACRCSIFSDMSFVTFDGRYLALFKEASYILSLTEDESITVQVSKCRPTNGVNNRDEVTLCLSVLELTHLSNQIVIDRINRKVAVNSRYAWPMVRKYGYKIVDTGNMYLIDTPTNVKIQWFHSTGLMIIESNATSKPPSMGLCGFCDGNTTNDFILPNGRVLGKSDDAAEFLDSWQVPYTLKYVGKERHQDVNCSVMDCSECFGMVLNQAFTSCHPYVSPEAFCELWVQDTEYIEDQCKALTAYASMCHKFNICMEWRSLDYCPFQCPETLRYQPCLPVCDVPRTCQNNEIDLYDTESCSALTEGCVCAQGTLLHRPYSTLCIADAKCACTDSSGTPRAIGEVWKTSVSGCCMHKCIDNDTIIPVEYNCSDVPGPQCSRYGEVVISVSDNQTCCPRKVCVCNQTICDGLVPECGLMEKLSSYYQEDSCCPRYICECDPEKCEPAEKIQGCRDDQTLFVAHVNNSCCIKPFCACNVCTDNIPNCRDGEVLMVDGNFTEKCCPSYKCVCDTARCPGMTCDLGMSLVEIWSPDSCCPYKTCECSCDTFPKPECKLGEKLQIDEERSDGFANVCNCTAYKCVRDTVCLSNARGVLRPGQTIIEHTSDGVCHSTHCSTSIDPVTNYHRLNVTSSNCAAKCEPNQAYVPPRDSATCCGSCKNTSCAQTLLNGTLLSHQPGTSWNSKCVKYDCTNTSVGPVLVTSAINCPPFNETECIKIGGYVVSFLDGCCKTCKEDGKFCKRVTVRMTIRKNDCRSNTPVNIVSCDGKCPSASIYNYNINTYARFCKCCRELGLQRRVVQLFCSANSTWVNYSIQEPTDCSCQWS